MKKNWTFPGILLLAIVFLTACNELNQRGQGETFPDQGQFSNPDPVYRAYQGVRWDLASINEEEAVGKIRHYHERGFGGVFIRALHGNAGDLDEAYVEQAEPFMKFGREGIAYMDSNYVRLYRSSLDEAEKLGMKVLLWDDYNFPTGQVAGQFYQRFPEFMAARLDKTEADHIGAGSVTLEVPEGTYLGAALMNMESLQIRDVSDRHQDGRITCQVSKGSWKLMAFYLNHEAVLKIRNPGIINYIDKEAVAKFLSISYEKYFEGFGEYFGSVISMSYYDEPSLHWLDGKIWSARLNDLYRERYGESPIRYYPALWYDIGDQTASARNALYGLRAEMYADAFVKQLHDWCTAHGIRLSGHMDQEEIANPVMINGDLMKVFENQDVPGADDAFWWGKVNPGLKIVTSASYNYDKPVTWAESYGGYLECNADTAYKVLMDQYAMGVNMEVCYPLRLEEFMSIKELVEFNLYTGRLSYMLQGGRHVSDIAVIYPIASAQAYNVLGDGWEYAYTGGEVPPEYDYQAVGEDLFRKLRIDFTYLHPEVLESRCRISDGYMILDNKVNQEKYKILVLPGGSTLDAESAVKLLAFFMQGGKVIATGRLPVYSAEFGKDEVVRTAMTELFGISRDALMTDQSTAGRSYVENSNPAGGKAIFVPISSPRVLNKVLDQCLPVRDVAFDQKEGMAMQNPGYKGALTYTHKVKNEKDIYFFSNSTEEELETMVSVRGKKILTGWDPHNGKVEIVPCETSLLGGTVVTQFKLSLHRTSSLFLISE